MYNDYYIFIFNFYHRNVWKIYLDQEKFDLAQKYAAVNMRERERGGGGTLNTFIYTLG